MNDAFRTVLLVKYDTHTSSIAVETASEINAEVEALAGLKRTPLSFPTLTIPSEIRTQVKDARQIALPIVLRP